MKFVCDSCHAQYMISDDKVGANGVKVRCKKCSNIIVVKKVVEPDPTVVMQNPLAGGNADAPFGGLDMDEIGQAFDSVLTSGPHSRSELDKGGGSDEQTNPGNNGSGNPFPMAAAGANGDSESDHESTRVMDVKAMASMAAAADASEERTSINVIPDAIKAQGYVDPNKRNEANGHSNGTNGIPTTDWYAAINEEQQGPLTLEVIKGHWEAGRITSDSLVWRSGYGDWKPLSTVADLVKVLTPIPTPRKVVEKAPEPVAPAGATASGLQTPFVTPAPAAVPDPDEVDWKPSAASALASLVADEMEALSKPAPKKRDEPVGVGETTGLKPVLATLEANASSNSLPLPPPESPLPQGRLPDPEPEPIRARPQPVPQPYPSQQDVPVYPAPAAYVPPMPTANNTKYVIGGLAVVFVCLTAVGMTWMLKTPTPAPQPIAIERPQPAPQPVAAQPVAPQPVAPQPVAAQPVAPQPVAVQPVAPQPVAAVQPIPVAPQPAANIPGETKEQRKARFDKWKADHEAAIAAKQAKAEEMKQEKADKKAAEKAAKDAEPVKVKASSDGDLLGGAGGSKIDKDFDNLLGGSGEKKSEDAPAPKKKGKPDDVYIPDAVGTANLPDQLGQGDVMGGVASHKSQIVACINKQRAKDPDASGSVKMHWVIQKNGSVNGVAIASDEFKSSVIGTCMSAAIKGWKFPQFSGAPMPIDFPFKF